MNPTSQSEASPAIDPIDRVLRSEDPLVPSSGFAASVFEKVQLHASRLATQPAPIPFPWKLAAPGLGVLALVVALLIPFLGEPQRGPSLSVPPVAFLHQISLLTGALERAQAGPALLALAGALFCLGLSRRLAR